MLLSCDSSSPQTPSSWQHQVTYVQTGLFWKVRTNGTTQCFASDLFYSAQCFQPFLFIYSLLLSNPPVYEARGVL